jgi:hypothetical protein
MLPCNESMRFAVGQHPHHVSESNTMSLQPSHDLLATLRDTLCKIEADPAPSNSLLDLRAIVLRRIEMMEAAHRLLEPRMNPMHSTREFV